jgi:hypothetical protein
MYNTMSYKIARGLGWFSIGLGVAELMAPGALNRSLGMREHNTLVRGFGLREIGAGLGILTMKHPVPWVWARVAGDVLDLSSLLVSLGPNNPRRGSATAAFLSVVGITAIDILTARSLEQHEAYRRLPRRDYSGRSGFKSSPDQMRGAAARAGNGRNATAKRA